MILIVSIRDDLHALAVQDAVRRRGRACRLLECDVVREHPFSWSSLPAGSSRTLLHLDGSPCDMADVDVVWWRRVRADQQIDPAEYSDTAATLIHNDSRAALQGALLEAGDPWWVSRPDATDRAGNKICQLHAALRCGFRIPDTLVSNDPARVRPFLARDTCRFIVKPVVGAPGSLLFTQFLTADALPSDQSIRAAPAIYQEYIAGTRHIRLNCFGDRSLAALIDTPDLDWRPNLHVPIRPWPVPDDLHHRTRAVLDTLGLEMGVCDLKLDPSGEPIWLEVNPQGQFLFLEGLTGQALTEQFTDFLLSGSTRRRPPPPPTPEPSAASFKSQTSILDS